MEPLKININVEVGLKQTTLETLSQIFGAKMTVTKLVETETAPQPDPQPEPQPEPQPQGADPIGTGAEEDDDLPMPTEDDARKAVKAAKDRKVSPKAIRDFMVENFNITSSIECPAERRQELINGLNRLSA